MSYKSTFINNNIYLTFTKLIYKGISYSKELFYYILILVVSVTIFYILMNHTTMVYKEVYHEYMTNVNNIKMSYIRYILEQRFVFKDNSTFNYKCNTFIYKVNRCFEINKELMFNTNPGIYQTIINEVNLDFRSVNTSPIITNSTHLSPIIERININNLFNTFTINTVSITEPIINNNLGINSNRNSLTLNTSIDALNSRTKNKELLNYQSNILYLLINKISPSLY